MPTRWLRWPLLLLFLLVAMPAGAGEIHLLGGATWQSDPQTRTYAFQLEYLEGLGEHFAASFAYMNQGHFPRHHRDGVGLTLWMRKNLLQNRLSLAAGAGGFQYYDTTRPGPGGTPEDKHGWGSLVSGTATWYTDSRWLYQLKGTYAKAANSFNIFTLLCGVGYQLDAPSSPGPRRWSPPQTRPAIGHELTLLAGQNVVNIPGGGKSAAASLEYRQGLWRYLEYTVSAIYEGATIKTNRFGLAVQGWLAKAFLDDRLTLGAGFGPYLAIDRQRQNGNRRGPFLAELFTLSGSYRIYSPWVMRVSWHRVITNYSRDSDLFLGGLGYRF